MWFGLLCSVLILLALLAHPFCYHGAFNVTSREVKMYFLALCQEKHRRNVQIKPISGWQQKKLKNAASVAQHHWFNVGAVGCLWRNFCYRFQVSSPTRVAPPACCWLINADNFFIFFFIHFLEILTEPARTPPERMPRFVNAKSAKISAKSVIFLSITYQERDNNSSNHYRSTVVGQSIKKAVAPELLSRHPNLRVHMPLLSAFNLV